MDSDPDSRVDLFISCHESENLSNQFTTLGLASSTGRVVRHHASNMGAQPSVFIGSMISRREIPEAVLQTRPGGLALFLITPDFFSNLLCIAELQAFLEMSSDPNVNLKLRFVCLNTSANDIRSCPSVNRHVPALSQYRLLEGICVTTIQATAQELSKVVFGAWECTDGGISPQVLPTVLGRTRYESFLNLQRMFTEDDLPVFRALLSLPRNATNVLDAFMMASERKTVTQHNVKRLYDVITFRSSPAGQAQRRIVEAYEQKWVNSAGLSWGDDIRRRLKRRFENMEIGSSQASSSSGHHIGSRTPEGDLQETAETEAPRETSDVFQPYFDKPKQWGKVVLDFTIEDEEGKPKPKSAEGKLLLEVLKPLKGTVSASGRQSSATCGMGGVGKTTALRALCYEDRVKEMFHDGIGFLELGKDANDSKLIKQLARFVDLFGGRNLAEEVKGSGSLNSALEKTAEWIRDKTVLLVCDDLWADDKRKYGYLSDLRKLQQHAPESKLVISTRDRIIAANADESVEFAPLDAEDIKARKILLEAVLSTDNVNEADFSGEDAEKGIRSILGTCAGLPLALAIAGQGLKMSVKDSSSVSIGLKLYADNLAPDDDCIMEGVFEHYPGLVKVIRSSVKHCQEWGKSRKVTKRYGTLNMRSMFKGLCVLEKQMTIPKRVLMHVWSKDVKCTEKVMSKFANCSLAKRVPIGDSKQLEFGLRLHDLVLERVHEMTKEGRSKWHKRIVKAYEKELNEDSNYGDEEGEKSQAWWSAKDDGYILAHLPRHLVLSNQTCELKLLLGDIRWTMHRMKFGGSVALNSDFERLLEAVDSTEIGMKRVSKVLKDSTPYTREEGSVLAFYIFAHLSENERKGTHLAKLLKSINLHFPKPWLRPANRYKAVRDSREEWKEVFTNDVQDIIADWNKEVVFVATGTQITCWSTSFRQPIWTTPHRAIAVALSRDGSTIVSGSYDNTIHRWNPENGVQIGDAPIEHGSSISCVSVSKDGNVIASGSSDKLIRLWNSQSGAQICEPLAGHDDIVNCVALIQDEKVIVSGSSDMTLRRWNAQTGAQIDEPLTGHEDSVTCMTVSKNVIVSGSMDKTIRIWNARSGAQIGGPLIGHEEGVLCVSLSEDEKVIVSGSVDSTIRLWNAKNGAQIGEPLVGHEEEVMGISLSADGGIVVSGSRDNTMRRWDAHSKAKIGDPLQGHKGFVSSVWVSKDGNEVVSASFDKTIRRWNSRSGEQIGKPFVGHEDRVTCVSMTEDGNDILSGSWDKTVRRWNTRSGVQTGGPFIGHKQDVLCVAWIEDGIIIVSGSKDKTLRRWNAQSGAQVDEPLVGHEEAVACILVSKDRSVVFSGSWDRTIRRWNARSGKPIGKPLTGHSGPVTCLALSENGKVVVSGSEDNTIRRWNAESGKPIGEPLIGHKEAVVYVTVSADGGVVLSGSRDNTIRRWDRCGEERGSSSVSSLVRSSERDSVLYRAPTDMVCRAMNLEKQFFVLALRNGCVAICHAMK